MFSRSILLLSFFILSLSVYSAPVDWGGGSSTGGGTSAAETRSLANEANILLIDSGQLVQDTNLATEITNRTTADTTHTADITALEAEQVIQDTALATEVT